MVFESSTRVVSFVIICYVLLSFFRLIFLAVQRGSGGGTIGVHVVDERVLVGPAVGLDPICCSCCG